jgi:hypothetical protein
VVPLRASKVVVIVHGLAGLPLPPTVGPLTPENGVPLNP